ncbi:MAG: GGDEF domain-containing protein [Actinomycetota bacterium]|nr:GGDEF domain-containing protein [Actinomycetota bacterium]
MAYAYLSRQDVVRVARLVLPSHAPSPLGWADRRPRPRCTTASRTIRACCTSTPPARCRNRLGLRLELERALAHAADAGTVLAVLFIDLDRFKQVNDVLGHSAGDSLLRQSVPRLAEELGEADSIGRVGGDGSPWSCPTSAGRGRPGGRRAAAGRAAAPLRGQRGGPHRGRQHRPRDVPRAGRTYASLFHHADRACTPRRPSAGRVPCTTPTGRPGTASGSPCWASSGPPCAATTCCCTTNRRSSSTVAGPRGRRRWCAGTAPGATSCRPTVSCPRPNRRA